MERSEPTNLLDRPSFTIGQPSPFDTSDAEENSNLEAPLPSDDAQLLIGEESGEASSNKEESPPSQSDSRDENSGEPSKTKIAKTPSRILTTDTTHVQIEPSHVIEYEWPAKSGEFYFIQEQISQLLDVKSFKRKYPEMSRRTVEPSERDHLLAHLNLGESLPPHYSNHLTALQAVEVHDLMSTEYPLIYAEYQKCVADRRKQNLLEKQKELDMIKSDAKKMDELRKKAIQSAFEFNTELQTVKKSERKYFLDVQTSIIQSAANKWYRMPKELSKPSAYPVALIPGQYTSHFKRFSFDKLNRLPLNSVMTNEDLFPPKRELSPVPIRVTEQELARKTAALENGVDHLPAPLLKEENEASDRAGISKDRESKDQTPQKLIRRSSTSSSIASAAKKSRKNSTANNHNLETKQEDISVAGSAMCIVCNQINGEIPLVKCAICVQHMHHNCIDMPRSMVAVVSRYEWSCIDCKMCDVCRKPDQEDAMMCCDTCDRGFHTFCVGLDQPPCGAWMCANCNGKK
ncbi:PHD-finger domain-containing protein [Ditylenchus destructor]|uniref:PHD-finger domain-containing protein n=1 Tax=Ditylenchus destructor TaxID=166010 RepID=A0AAD4NBF0_9BILA|nr:PHD-finger domain-containing protein [Ditylenchus destructor]